MGSFRFRRSVRIAPGVRLNVNKRSIGLSAGVRGARVSVNSDGRSTRSVGVPGTGLYYRSQKGPRRSKGNVRPGAASVLAGAVSPGLLLARIFLWTLVFIGLVLAFSGKSGPAGGVIAAGIVGWLVLRLLRPVVDAVFFAWPRRSHTPVTAPVTTTSTSTPAVPPPVLDEDLELAPANVAADWRHADGWRSWEAPRDFVAGESHYVTALRELAGTPRPHGYLIPVEVVFIREPSNAYDSNAWRAEVDGRHIGYVRAHIAAQVATGLDPLGVTIFTVCGVIRGGSLEAPSLGVHIWPARRPIPGPALQQVDDALGVAWPPNVDEGANTAAIDQFAVYVQRAHATMDAGGPEDRVLDCIKAATDIAVANGDDEQKEAAAAVAERLIRYARGTETLARAARLKKRVEPKVRTTRQGAESVEDRLARLTELHERGVITDDEYAMQRAAVVKQL